MKPLAKSQIRLNLIDLVIEHVRGLGPATDPDLAPFLRLLTIYRTDTVRLMTGQNGRLDDLEYLASSLKPGVRIASKLINEILESDSQALAHWYYGAEPLNQVQALYSLLVETSLELSKNIMQIESQHPELKFIFDNEREAYHRIHTQWDLEDAAELQHG